MNLGQVRVSFPVLQLKTRVFHSTPRPPTAFERMLLKLCDRFGSHATYNSISLERVFSDILGVAEPNLTVQPTLQELLDLDVLHCHRSTTSLGKITIRDLEITAERGRQMLTDGMLPAQAQEADVTHFYDPVRRRFLSEKESRLLRRQPLSSSVDHTVFQDVYPEEEIRQRVPLDGYAWWHERSRIERLVRQGTEVQWLEVQGSIDLEGGVLRVTLRDKDQTNYLNSLPGEELFNRILAPSLVGGFPDSFQATLLAPTESAQLNNDNEATWLALPPLLEEFPGTEKVWLVNPRSLVKPPAEAPAHRCFVVCDV